MIATDNESDDLSRKATRTMSQDPQGQHQQHDLATISLDTDSDLTLWLQHTGFFDIEHRHKVLGALRKLKDIDEQRCKIVSEVRSSTEYYLVSPTPQRSTALASSLSSSSLAAQKTRQSAVYDYIDSRSAAFAGSNERCGSEISSLTRGAGSDNGYMTFADRPASRQGPDAAPSSIASMQQGPRPSVEATTSPVDPDHVSPEAESSPPALGWGEPFDAGPVPRRLGKGKSVNKYPLAQILSSVPKQDERYFLVKSFNVSNVEKSQRDGLWITKAKNGALFANAFNQHKNVYLIFSINKSKAFQGYARMTSPPNANIPPANWMSNIAWEASSPFRVEWLNTRSTEFWKLGDLKNPLNDGSPVFVGRDGQEYPEACGRKMIRILDRVDRGTRERRGRAAESSPRRERRQTYGDRGKLEEEERGEVKDTPSPWRRDEVSQNGDAASASTADDLLLLEY
ncbi:YT521-B-like domain-containing protein [Trichoderma novae-zelandiae]